MSPVYCVTYVSLLTPERGMVLGFLPRRHLTHPVRHWRRPQGDSSVYLSNVDGG